MSTFLELCKIYRSELGIPGDGPATVVNQIGELARVVEDIRNANTDIQNRWHDWKFLHRTHTTQTVVGSLRLVESKPTNIGVWNTNSVWLDKTTASPIHLEYVDYDTFRDNVLVGLPATDQPYQFTIKPDNSLEVYPLADDEYTLTAEYWRKPEILTSDAQISLLPEQFHRAIVVRAKLYYAEREDAPEIMAGSSAEFDDLMFQLEAHQLRDQDVGKQARAVRPNVVIVE